MYILKSRIEPVIDDLWNDFESRLANIDYAEDVLTFEEYTNGYDDDDDDFLHYKYIIKLVKN